MQYYLGKGWPSMEELFIVFNLRRVRIHGSFVIGIIYEMGFDMRREERG